MFCQRVQNFYYLLRVCVGGGEGGGGSGSVALFP